MFTKFKLNKIIIVITYISILYLLREFTYIAARASTAM